MPGRENESREERLARHEAKRRRVAEHRSEVLRRSAAREGVQALHSGGGYYSCPVIFSAPLPPLPVEAKHLALPLPEDALSAYDVVSGCAAERAACNALHIEPDVGIPISLLHPAHFLLPRASEKAPLAEADAEITSSAYARPSTLVEKGAAAYTTNVDWMRKSMHMHLDLYDSVYKHADPAALQATLQKQRQASIAAKLQGTPKERVAKSFAQVTGDVALVHPINKSAQPTRVWEVLPDVERWAQQRVLVAFDADPTESPTAGRVDAVPAPPAAKRARVERAVLRTSAKQPVNAAEGVATVDFCAPAAEDVSAGPTEPLLLSGVRTFHAALQRVGRAFNTDDLFTLTFDDPAGVVRIAPIHARAVVSKHAAEEAASGVQSIVSFPREALPEEEDAAEEARLRLTADDARDALAAIAQRRAARRAAAEAMSAAAATPTHDSAALTRAAYVSTLDESEEEQLSE